MSELSKQELVERKNWVQDIVRHYLNTDAKKIIFKPAGLTNSVFHVSAGGEQYIVRLGESPGKLQDFIKEQWITHRVREHGLPVAEILEVGCDLVPRPYMIQKAVAGQTALYHPRSLDILRELAGYAMRLHTIETTGFGRMFDWSANVLSKNNSWKDFLLSEIDVFGRLQFFEDHQLILRPALGRLRSLVSQIAEWGDVHPRLAHGDLRLKNVIVDRQGKIQAILDWENGLSTEALLWDLSVALHDLSIDEKEAFLQAYGLSPEQLVDISPVLQALNTLHYSDVLRKMIAENDHEAINWYRRRLSGDLDLYWH